MSNSSKSPEILKPRPWPRPSELWTFNGLERSLEMHLHHSSEVRGQEPSCLLNRQKEISCQGGSSYNGCTFYEEGSKVAMVTSRWWLISSGFFSRDHLWNSFLTVLLKKSLSVYVRLLPRRRMARYSRRASLLVADILVWCALSKNF